MEKYDEVRLGAPWPWSIRAARRLKPRQSRHFSHAPGIPVRLRRVAFSAVNQPAA